jgi:hypothetical protein
LRTIVILLAVIAAFYIIRYFLQRSGLSKKQIYRKMALYGLALIMLLLLVTGRLHWVFAAVAAALPFLGRMLPLLRFVPFLRSLYQRYQNSQNLGGAAQGAQGGGKTSSVQSRYLHMRLDHASGEMDGEIVAGRHNGKHLNEFTVPQLIELFEDFADDQDSMALLQAYMDRVHSDWREQAQSASGQAAGERQHNGAADNKISEQEAYEILGLQSGADRDQIIGAHRRLMQKLHPDRGGSVYLASKINMAKDFLLKKFNQRKAG